MKVRQVSDGRKVIPFSGWLATSLNTRDISFITSNFLDVINKEKILEHVKQYWKKNRDKIDERRRDLRLLKKRGNNPSSGLVV
jgi:hypothetical protein